MSRTALYAGKMWIVLAGVYLLFAGQVSATEIMAGAVAALLSAIIVTLRKGAETRHMRLHPGWAGTRALIRPLLALYPDSVRVGRQLLLAIWRRPDGSLGAVTPQSFQFGAPGSAVDAGRQALVVLGTSLAPNGYVVQILGDVGVLAMHRLAEVPPVPDPVWPT